MKDGKKLFLVSVVIFCAGARSEILTPKGKLVISSVVKGSPIPKALSLACVLAAFCIASALYLKVSGSIS